MMQYQVSAKKLEVDRELDSYIQKKIARLDRLFPRSHRPSKAHIELSRDESANPDKRYHAGVKIEVSGPDLFAETATMNPHSAIDIVEAKLKEQIRRYKEKHAPKRISLKRSAPLATEVGAED